MGNYGIWTIKKSIVEKLIVMSCAFYDTFLNFSPKYFGTNKGF